MFDVALKHFCDWLAATALSHTIQTVSWIIPTVQTIHILCVAVLFTSAVLVDLRVWRLLDRDVPVADVARRFLPPIWPIVLVLLITGSLLIIGEPRRSLLNSTFYLKMALLVVALVLTAILQRSLSSAPNKIAKWPMEQLAAAASIFVWSGILFAGRWIAYTQAG
jgi:uncharacterized membrane protein